MELFSVALFIESEQDSDVDKEKCICDLFIRSGTSVRACVCMLVVWARLSSCRTADEIRPDEVNKRTIRTKSKDSMDHGIHSVIYMQSFTDRQTDRQTKRTCNNSAKHSLNKTE